MANETTIGAKLRQARLDKHISLDELQQMTKVQKGIWRQSKPIVLNNYQELFMFVHLFVNMPPL
ncbi:Transcriptional regulator in clusterwithunspecified monosaccharide ABC transport system [Enterococcus sp. HSIEG1]|nr:Transcriptional regulator in clusterwithunspecified monosaccharide ABC transport system [Enterococcus sp. HSIEG1]